MTPRNRPLLSTRAVSSAHFYCTWLGIVFSLAATLMRAEAVIQTPFTASDFSLIIQPETPTVQPGHGVTFDGILYNLSAQPANFGANILLYGASSSPEIDGNNLFGSPYISSISFNFFPPGQTIDPGGHVQFQFMTVQTLPSIPLGAVITTGPGNFLFQIIPRSTPDPFVDFFIPQSLASVVVAVPEPGALLLAGPGLLLVAIRRMRRR